ncbi:MAG TPA: hypothetical protein VIH42_07860 [Thermoguttaceae bacterium]
MNENTRKSLMIIVERAVRPVRAGEARKLHMREELLAHLTAIFEDEVARCNDEHVAMQQAQIRFGDPHKLAKELQQSVPILNRIRYLLEIASFKPDDSWLQLIGKYLLGTLIMVAILVLLLLIGLSLDGRSMAWKIMAFEIRFYILAKVMPIIMGFMMLGILFIDRLRKTFFSQGSRLLGARAAIDIIISFFAFPVLAFINYAVQTGDLTGSLKFFYEGCMIAPVAPLLFILMARQYDREMRAQEEWKNLEIDE